VTKVHHEARRFAAEDYDILLIGHEGHEEVIGTSGEAPAHIQLVDGPDGVDKVTVRDPEKVVWLSQTTLSVDETLETVAQLKKKLPLLQSPPSDDICYATQNRQQVMKQIALDCDVVLVVGSKNSSNSVRMVEVAVQAGAAQGHLIDFAHEIEDEWLEGATTVGLSSGASVPEELVEQVLAHLAERGFGDVEEVVTVDERLVFSLPQELKRDMKAAASRG
jgi:4-hydroxy-3-methylbut-2-enyl diphosphate reductase